MRVDTPARHGERLARGGAELKLLVTDAGDGINCDHADWADAVFVSRSRRPGNCSDQPGSRCFALRDGPSRRGRPDRRSQAGRFEPAIGGATGVSGCRTIGPIVATGIPGGGVASLASWPTRRTRLHRHRDSSRPPATACAGRWRSR